MVRVTKTHPMLKLIKYCFMCPKNKGGKRNISNESRNTCKYILSILHTTCICMIKALILL